MHRVAGICLLVGAFTLGIGAFLTWQTSEGGIPPRVESTNPISEDGGWTILVSVAVCAAVGMLMLVRGRIGRGRSALFGGIALLAAVWAFIAAKAVTDPAVLGNVGAWESGPARPVMFLGVGLCAMGAALTALRVAERPA